VYEGHRRFRSGRAGWDGTWSGTELEMERGHSCMIGE